jgi:hypothetical protein
MNKKFNLISNTYNFKNFYKFNKHFKNEHYFLNLDINSEEIDWKTRVSNFAKVLESIYEVTGNDVILKLIRDFSDRTPIITNLERRKGLFKKKLFSVSFFFLSKMHPLYRTQSFFVRSSLESLKKLKQKYFLRRKNLYISPNRKKILRKWRILKTSLLLRRRRFFNNFEIDNLKNRQIYSKHWYYYFKFFNYQKKLFFYKKLRLENLFFNRLNLRFWKNVTRNILKFNTFYYNSSFRFNLIRSRYKRTFKSKAKIKNFMVNKFAFMKKSLRLQKLISDLNFFLLKKNGSRVSSKKAYILVKENIVPLTQIFLKKNNAYIKINDHLKQKIKERLKQYSFFKFFKKDTKFLIKKNKYTFLKFKNKKIEKIPFFKLLILFKKKLKKNIIKNNIILKEILEKNFIIDNKNLNLLKLYLKYSLNKKYLSKDNTKYFTFLNFFFKQKNTFLFKKCELFKKILLRKNYFLKFLEYLNKKLKKKKAILNSQNILNYYNVFNSFKNKNINLNKKNLYENLLKINKKKKKN